MSSRGVNKVILVGNVCKDLDIRYTQDGKAVASFTVATSESWKDKQGQPQEKAEFHRVSIFGKLAEIAGEYLRKGSQVYIEGKLQTRKWTNKEGQDQYTTEIVLDPFNGVMQMLGGKSDNSGHVNNPSQHNTQQPQQKQAAPQQRQSQQNQRPMSEPDFDMNDDSQPPW